MTLKELLLHNRSYRRFDQSHFIPQHTLVELIDLARLAPSARNMQPLRYVLVNDAEVNSQIFPCLAWAGYLKEWPGPVEGERPSAYIVITRDTALGENIFCDDGLAIQTILLGAVEQGLGGCIIGAVNRRKVAELLAIDEQYEILYVLALGKPVETVVLEEMQEGKVQYWRDENQHHHVPKRSLDELVLKSIGNK